MNATANLDLAIALAKERASALLEFAHSPNQPPQSSTAINDSAERLAERLFSVTTNAAKTNVGFIGDRGTGKTTLINALLEHANLFPTGPVGTTTAAVVEVSGTEDDSTGYQVLVWFKNLADWEEFAVEARQAFDELSDEERRQKLPNVVQRLRLELQAMWATAQIPDLTLGIPDDIHRIALQGHLTIRADTLEQLQQILRDYTDRRRRFWPLVHKINVAGPFALLCRAKVTVLDIPGIQDGDVCMTRLCELGLERSDRIFFLPAPKDLTTIATAEKWAYSDWAYFKRIGFIVTYGATVLQSDSPPEVSLEDRIRNMLLIGVSGLADSDAFRDLLQNADIYCFENNERDFNYLPESQRQLLIASRNRFAADLVEGAELELEGIRRRYLNDINYFLAEEEERLSLSLEHQRIGQEESEILLRRGTVLRQLVEPYANSLGSFPEVHSFFAPPVRTALQQNLAAFLDANHYSEIRKLLLSQRDWMFNSFISKVVDLLSSGSTFGQLGREMERVDASIRQAAIDLMGTSPLQQELQTILQHQLHTDRFAFVKLLRSELALYVQSLTSDFPTFARTGRASKAEMISLLLNWFASKITRDGIIQLLERQWHAAVAKLVDEWYNIIMSHATALNAARRVHDENDRQRCRSLIELCNRLHLDVAPMEQDEPVVEDAVMADEVHADDQASSPRDRLRSFCQANNLKSVEFIRISPRHYYSGHIYVLSNPSMANLYKIGFTTLTAQTRARQLFTTGVPTPFAIEHISPSCDRCRRLEMILHQMFSSYRSSSRREFFAAPLTVIQRAVDLARAYVDSFR